MARLSADIEEQIDRALAEATDVPPERMAVGARFDAPTNMLILVLGDGRRVAIPREDLQGLATASDEDVAQVEIDMLGMALHWEKPDMDFLVEGLLEGRTGNEGWMERLEEKRRKNAAAALSRTA
jgi:hypothetical protein